MVNRHLEGSPTRLALPFHHLVRSFPCCCYRRRFRRVLMKRKAGKRTKSPFLEIPVAFQGAARWIAFSLHRLLAPFAELHRAACCNSWHGPLPFLLPFRQRVEAGQPDCTISH